MKELPPSNVEPAVRLRGVGVAFGPRVVLKDLDMEVGRGQAIALLGPSGAGKTTLFRVLTGSQRIDTGSLAVLGEDPASLSRRGLRELRLRIGHIYQNDALIPGLRTIHNVLIGRLGSWSLAKSLWSLLFPREEDLVREALGRVGLADRIDAPIHTLSGGQRQRVSIARMLVQDPELVLADEPSSSLDPRLAREAVEMLVGLAKEEGRTCLVSLHDTSLIGDHFDRVLCLRDGGWFFDGMPGDLSPGLLEELFAGEPE